MYNNNLFLTHLIVVGNDDDDEYDEEFVVVNLPNALPFDRLIPS